MIVLAVIDDRLGRGRADRLRLLDLLSVGHRREIGLEHLVELGHLVLFGCGEDVVRGDRRSERLVGAGRVCRDGGEGHVLCRYRVHRIMHRRVGHRDPAHLLVGVKLLERGVRVFVPLDHDLGLRLRCWQRAFRIGAGHGKRHCGHCYWQRDESEVRHCIPMVYLSNSANYCVDGAEPS